MSERIRGALRNALYKWTYTLLHYYSRVSKQRFRGHLLLDWPQMPTFTANLQSAAFRGRQSLYCTFLLRL